jgi:hypothetical protein
VCHSIFSGYLNPGEGSLNSRPPGLNNNFPHLKGGVQLTVALFAPVFFPALFLKDNDFLGLTLAQDLTDHPGSLHQGLAHLDGVAVGYQQHLIEEYFISPLSRKALHPEDVSRGYPILFPAGLDDGEQGNLQMNFNQ